MTVFNEYIKIFEYILLVLFGLSFLWQMIYYTRFYLPVVLGKASTKADGYEPVSVIICARNEGENLKKNLRSVLEQDYPDFEVIVVNDCSNDDTDMVLGEYLEKYKNLRTTSIAEDLKFSHGKKLAVTVGIKSAKNEWLIFTDADCYAESDQWLKTISSKFDSNEIVLGYGGYKRERSLLNNFIRYETMMIALQYFGFAKARIPYMGVGRNLAYKKSLFFKNKGFASHYGLQSGDDDLFVNEAATKTNTNIEYRLESHTRSIPHTTFKGWRKQKARHFTTTNRYKKKHYVLLASEPVSRAYFYLSLILLLSFQIFWEYILIFAAVRLIILLTIVGLTSKRLNEKNMILTSVFFDLTSLFTNFIIYISSRLRRKNVQWK